MSDATNHTNGTATSDGRSVQSHDPQGRLEDSSPRSGPPTSADLSDLPARIGYGDLGTSAPPSMTEARTPQRGRERRMENEPMVDPGHPAIEFMTIIGPAGDC